MSKHAENLSAWRWLSLFTEPISLPSPEGIMPLLGWSKPSFSPDCSAQSRSFTPLRGLPGQNCHVNNKVTFADICTDDYKARLSKCWPLAPWPGIGEVQKYSPKIYHLGIWGNRKTGTISPTFSCLSPEKQTTKPRNNHLAFPCL